MPIKRPSSTLLVMIGIAAIAPAAFAHATDAARSFAWNADPWIIASLTAAALLYACGIRRLWRNAHRGAGISRRQAGYFAAGLAMLAVALLSPVDTLGTQLFSMHMVQHELLMLAAAPLLVLGNPLAVFVWAFPSAARKRIAHLANARAVQQPWRTLTQPLAAWSLHAFALWAWHFPRLFQAGLADGAVHAVQHASFLISALLFWSALTGLQSRLRHGAAVLYLLSSAIHTGVLGALLTFSPHAWYPAYSGGTEVWGLTLLEDQQLGGLIMWVPAGFVFVFAGLMAAAKAIGPDNHDTPQAATGLGRQP